MRDQGPRVVDGVGGRRRSSDEIEGRDADDANEGELPSHDAVITQKPQFGR